MSDYAYDVEINSKVTDGEWSEDAPVIESEWIIDSEPHPFQIPASEYTDWMPSSN